MQSHKRKAVLVTGASGLIGRHLAMPLRQAGFAVHAVSREQRRENGVVWLQADVLRPETMEQALAQARPEFLLHLAWNTRPGSYLEDDANFSWLTSSLELMRLFRRYGGRRAVLAGTCFEYDFSNSPLAENSAIAPGTTYARCKDRLNRLAALYCHENGVSYCWGRVFSVYGPGEQAGRLTPSVIDAMRRNREFVLNGGTLRRDYMYAGDVAAAFAAILVSDVEGEINVCSGRAVALEQYCRLLARKMGREHLVRCDDHPGDQPPLIVGDNRRLREEVGFSPCWTLERGLDELLREETGRHNG